MKNKDVVLNRAGVIQLAGSMFSLLVLGFLAGAVVGFEAGNDVADGSGQVPTNGGMASGAMREVSATQIGVPTEAGSSLRMADLAAAVQSPESAAERETRREVASTDTGMVSTQVAPAADDGGDVLDVFEGRSVSAETRYAVQVGVFGIEANADRFAARLRSRGYDPLVVAMRNRSGQWMKRVHLSVLSSEDSAVALADSFTDREGLPAVVVAFWEDQE